MKEILLLLTIVCLPITCALKCHNTGPVDFTDNEANQEVLHFFDTLSDQFDKKEASYGELAQHFENLHMNNSKANDLLCEFAREVGITSPNGDYGFKCTACKAIFYLIRLLGGSHPADSVNSLIKFAQAACNKLKWIPCVKNVCHKYLWKGQLGALIARQTIQQDGGVQPAHICQRLSIC